MTSENGTHPFQTNPNPRYPNACARCGRTEDFHPSTLELRAITRMREYIALLGRRSTMSTEVGHSTYVQIRGPGGFFASCCRCGSDQFPDRERLHEAEKDAYIHGELHHVYPRDRLVAHDEH